MRDESRGFIFWLKAMIFFPITYFLLLGTYIGFLNPLRWGDNWLSNFS